MELFWSLFFFLICCLTRSEAGGSDTEWNYKDKGPDAWPHLYSTCKGEEQSPINIIKSGLKFKAGLSKINFNNYDKIFSWNLTYDSHSIKMSPNYDGNTKAYIDGSDFTETYELIQFHFHWGYNIYQGSEHLIDYLKFPLEVHFVHKSSSGRLAVLGFVFLPTDSSSGNALFDEISALNSTQSFRTLQLSLNSIVPINETTKLSSYYRYAGSLTTPPCSENVIWTVFDHKLTISSQYLKKSFYSNWPGVNFREAQQIMKRKIYSSFCVNDPCQLNGAKQVFMSFHSFILLVSAILFF